MVKAKVFVLQNLFDGFPKESDFKLIEEDLPQLNNGEFLAEAKFLTVDPYLRGAQQRIPLGEPLAVGGQVAKIIESKNPKFPVGEYILGPFGWRSHTISNGEATSMGPAPTILSDFGDLPKSLAVGILGMPGNTAYFGFLELCQPKSGEVVVVSGAAGAVGSHVGQIGKIKGCKVIGIAGSDEKGKWLTGELKFDHFINYKTENIDKVLSEIAPDGVDCYFDNVGGQISNTVLAHMREYGRIAICGQIAAHNDTTQPGVVIPREILGKQLKIEGFMVRRWRSRTKEAVQQNMSWIRQGKLIYKETITEGIENTPKAFISMLKGGNVGKAVVAVK